MDYLDVPSFIPRIWRYFGYFLPTLRSLALREPKGSRRQIVYFIGLFEYLEGLKFLYDSVYSQEELTGDQTLVLPFVPPPRGQLTATHFTGVGLLEDMVHLFGGIRFRRMDLCNVDGMRLLYACAETLETLQLYSTDPRGKEPFLDIVQVPAGSFAARSSRRDVDLSRTVSFRDLDFCV